MSSLCGNCQVESQACHSIYLQVIKVLKFDLGLLMNCYTFVVPSEKTKRFRLLSICANTVYNETKSLEDISSIRIICKDILHETLKYVDEFSELKNDQIKKEPLSLYLSICRCTLIFPKGYACTSLSLFLSLFTFAKTVWIQIRPEWNSGKNVSSI